MPWRWWERGTGRRDGERNKGKEEKSRRKGKGGERRWPVFLKECLKI